MRVAVVGAGLAGLSAVCALADAGHEVVLLERSRLLGGKATSFTVDSIEVDNGQHVHLGCCTEYLDFVSRLGMADRLWTQPRFEVTVLRRGRRPARLRASRLLPGRLRMLPSFALHRGLAPRARLEVARALARLSAPPRREESFADWLRRHRQGDAAVQGFWDLFVVPALNAEAHEVAAADALFVMRTAFAANAGAAAIGWSRVPLARIAEAAAARASEVRLRAPATGLVEAGGEVTGVRLAGGDTVVADAVVLAVPPARLRALLPHPEDLGLDGLGAFRTRAIVDIHLWFDAPVGLQFAAIAGSPVQWVFEKQPGYLCCSLSAADRLVACPETELVALCRDEVAAAWPALERARLVRGAATRDPDATFVPAPGLRRPGPRTTRPNVVVAGAWTATGWPATMESAVRSGRRAANALLATAVARRPTPQLEAVHG